MTPPRRPFLLLLAELLASVLGWIGMSVWTVGITVLIFAVYLVHRWLDPDLKITHRLASLWGRGLLRLAPGCRLEIQGVENLPSGGCAVLMANHQSYADVPALFSLPGHFKWMADADLFWIPFFGWSMKMAGYIPVRRGDPRQGVRSLEEAKRRLSRGISIFLFPEGTRSHTGVLGRFQTGGFRLAALAGAPIIPVVIAGTWQLLPRGSWIFRWGVSVKIRVLPPVPLVEGDLKQVRPLLAHVRRQMFSTYRELLQQIR